MARIKRMRFIGIIAKFIGRGVVGIGEFCINFFFGLDFNLEAIFRFTKNIKSVTINIRMPKKSLVDNIVQNTEE